MADVAKQIADLQAANAALVQKIADDESNLNQESFQKSTTEVNKLCTKKVCRGGMFFSRHQFQPTHGQSKSCQWFKIDSLRHFRRQSYWLIIDPLLGNDPLSVKKFGHFLK